MPRSNRNYVPVVIAIVASAGVWAAGLLGEYGWFGDELYFRACAKRPALGYADHPPLAPLILMGLRAVFGDALWAIRLVPVIAFAGSILLASRLARQLGGERLAESLAALLVATTPAILVVAGFYSMNPFDVFIAIALSSKLVAIAIDGDPQRWIAVGALAGIGLLGKHTAIIPIGLLGVAALRREHLRSKWFYGGVALACVIVAAHVAWLVEHDWITLDFYTAATEQKNVDTSALGALVGQALFVGPLGFAIAIAGAISLARRPYLRGFGIALFVGLVAMMIAQVSRPDRIVGLYPIALAAGAVVIERVTARRKQWLVFGLASYAVGVAVPLPLIVPVLPPPQLAAYADTLGITPQLEKQKAGAMPQWFADRLAWRDIAEQTAAAFATIDAADRSRVIVFGENYSITGALELYGGRVGLPSRVISNHNSYWLWAPAILRGVADPIFVAVTGDEPLLRRLFVDVQRAGTIRCEFCYENGTEIWIARRPHAPLVDVWPALRHLQ